MLRWKGVATWAMSTMSCGMLEDNSFESECEMGTKEVTNKNSTIMTVIITFPGCPAESEKRECEGKNAAKKR